MSKYLNRKTEKSRIVEINGEDYIIPICFHERYAARPDSLEHMCFAQFKIWYTPLSECPKKSKLEGLSKHEIVCPHLDEPECMPFVIELKDSLGFMRLRQFELVLKDFWGSSG